MSRAEVIKTKDFDKIKDIIFTDPNLMADDAKEQIKHLYYSIRDLKKELYDARIKVRELEELVKSREDDFIRVANLFTIEFETKEKEFITNEATIGISGLGNSTLGKQYMV